MPASAVRRTAVRVAAVDAGHTACSLGGNVVADARVAAVRRAGVRVVALTDARTDLRLRGQSWRTPASRLSVVQPLASLHSPAVAHGCSRGARGRTPASQLSVVQALPSASALAARRAARRSHVVAHPRPAVRRAGIAVPHCSAVVHRCTPRGRCCGKAGVTAIRGAGLTVAALAGGRARLRPSSTIIVANARSHVNRAAFACRTRRRSCTVCTLGKDGQTPPSAFLWSVRRSRVALAGGHALAAVEDRVLNTRVAAVQRAGILCCRWGVRRLEHAPAARRCQWCRRCCRARQRLRIGVGTRPWPVARVRRASDHLSLRPVLVSVFTHAGGRVARVRRARVVVVARRVLVSVNFTCTGGGSHVSVVHALLSLHVGVLVSVFTHAPVAGRTCPSCTRCCRCTSASWCRVHASPVAGSHVSVVHALLSLRRRLGVRVHASPVAGSHVSVVHALLSLRVGVLVSVFAPVAGSHVSVVPRCCCRCTSGSRCLFSHRPVAEFCGGRSCTRYCRHRRRYWCCCRCRVAVADIPATRRCRRSSGRGDRADCDPADSGCCRTRSVVAPSSRDLFGLPGVMSSWARLIPNRDVTSRVAAGMSKGVAGVNDLIRGRARARRARAVGADVRAGT